MSLYLQEAPYEEAMRVFYRADSPKPLLHTVWTGDFMGLCTHNIACPVCFDRAAVIERNVTPGQWDQTVQPCGQCQRDGHRVVHFPRWLARLFWSKP